jgi:hypothetical protein
MPKMKVQCGSSSHLKRSGEPVWVTEKSVLITPNSVLKSLRWGANITYGISAATSLKPVAVLGAILAVACYLTHRFKDPRLGMATILAPAVVYATS